MTTPGEEETTVEVSGTIIPGHGVASGRSGDVRFPGGTIAMQRPLFAARGLDLSGFHDGTLNVSIAPAAWSVVRPDHTFREIDWHPTEPPEDFSFVAVDLVVDGHAHQALVYLPHPDTKPDHVQPDDVVEVLAPFVPDLAVGDRVVLRFDPRRVEVTPGA